MNWRFGPFLRSVDQLARDLRRLDFSGRIVDNRGRFPIVLIDDKEFTPINNLRRYNFNITQFNDLQSIDAVSRYPIVLSDLLGVGLSFGPRLQGAQVIKEIKKNYPDKYVIAYTGGGSSEISELAILAIHEVQACPGGRLR